MASMNTTEAFLESINQSIANVEKQVNSQPRKGMMIYLDKSTHVMVQYANQESFNKAKSVSSRAGQSSCLRNVLDAGGRLQ